METLKISETDITPAIILDGESGILELRGRSIPENASGFYNPIILWINEYMKHPKNKTIFNFYLEYINSISQKMIIEIFHKIQTMKVENHQVLVNWHYDEDDDDMKDEGEILAERFEIPVELIPVEL